ncbi:MAG: hypothetical protein J6A19_07910 [Oscillospiraceae bacterium]|nr:hypothetical protein [Oscillospiraceae bacterium]
MKIKVLIIITAVFFAVMLALTFSARAIHEASLPHVRAQRLSTADFPFSYTDENGELRTGTRQAAAITKEQLERGVYVLYSAMKNGEKRDFVQCAEIVTGEQSGDYFEVVSGVSMVDRIIVEYDRELYDGGEVAVVK